jgi:hypothetical protein
MCHKGQLHNNMGVVQLIQGQVPEEVDGELVRCVSLLEEKSAAHVPLENMEALLVDAIAPYHQGVVAIVR